MTWTSDKDLGITIVKNRPPITPQLQLKQQNSQQHKKGSSNEIDSIQFNTNSTIATHETVYRVPKSQFRLKS